MSTPTASESLTTEAISTAKGMLDAIAAHDELQRVLWQRIEHDGAKTPQDLLHAYRTNHLTQRVVQQWKAEGRQVLSIHPELMNQAAMASSSKIPMEVLFTLPYVSPMIVFGEAFEYRINEAFEEESHRLVGFICFGLSQRMIATEHGLIHDIVTTHDPDVGRFGAMLVSEIVNDRGQVIDHEYNRMTFDLEGKFTIEEMAADMMRRYDWSEEWGGRKITAAQEFLTTLMRVMMGTVLYLCSTTLDVETVPRSRTARIGTVGVNRRPIKLDKIGWTIGPALRSLRLRYFEKDEPRGPGSGKPQLPQHRRCHFRTTWTGPGRTIPKTTFISPYWTHREMLGIDGTKTVHAVPVPK